MDRIKKKKAQFLKYQGAVQEQSFDSDSECASESDSDEDDN